MAKYLLKRILFILPAIIVTTFLAFVLLNLSPTSPAEMMVRSQNTGADPTPMQMEAFHRLHGTDKPVLDQYVIWLKKAVRGDLGSSWKDEQSVSEQYLKKLWISVQLFLAGELIAIILGLTLGIGAALKENSWIDYIASAMSSLTLSLPGFWIAMLLLYIFAVKLHLLPSYGYGGFRQILLPALTMGISGCGSLIKITRASIIEVKNKKYVRTAYAKGLSGRRVTVFHILRNALIPIVTSIGMAFTHMLGGSAIIENIFSWPGVGSYFLTAANARDLPIVMGYVLFTSVFLILINTVVDIIYMLVDPQISITGRKEKS